MLRVARTLRRLSFTCTNFIVQVILCLTLARPFIFSASSFHSCSFPCSAHACCCFCSSSLLLFSDFFFYWYFVFYVFVVHPVFPLSISIIFYRLLDFYFFLSCSPPNTSASLPHPPATSPPVSWSHCSDALH